MNSIALVGSACLLGIFTTRANRRRHCRQYRPAAILAAFDRFAQHASDQRAAASAAARAGADTGSFADLFEGFGAGLNRFDDGAFANFIAEAGRFEVFNDRLLSGFAFQFVDDEIPILYPYVGSIVAY
jgi:hypothetical protein